MGAVQCSPRVAVVAALETPLQRITLRLVVGGRPLLDPESRSAPAQILPLDEKHATKLVRIWNRDSVKA